MSDEDLKKLIASNAKAIEALTNQVNDSQKEKHQLYHYLGRIAAAQSDMYEAQSDYYQQLGNIQDQLAQFQGELTKQQSQIIKILNRLSITEDSE